MADIDTSSYPKAKSTNPLETLGGVANLQNTLNQNKLFQQQFNTNKAVSDIYKRAVKPDGTLDMDMIRDEVSKNPDAAYGLEQVFKGAQGLQQGQIKTNSDQIDLARKNVDIMGTYMTPLAANPKATRSDVLAAASQAIIMGHVKPEIIGQFLSTMPDDDGKVPAWVEQQHMRFLDTKQQFDALHPMPTQVDTPQGTRFVRTPAVGPVTDAGGYIPKVPGPTQQQYNPATQRNEFVGVLPNGGIGGAPQAQGAAPGAGMGGQPPAQAAPNAFAPGTPAGPALGEQEAAQVTQRGGAEQGLALTRRVEQVPVIKGILGNLEAELNTPGFNTGPGTENMAKLAKFMNTQMGQNIRTEGLAGREQFNKLAGMLAQSQFQALGGTGTDAKLDATTLTSPNAELTPLGNRGIIAMLKGNEDAIKAKNDEWQKWSAQHGTGTYGPFITQFQKSYDPRVFQAQYLGKEDRQKMLKGMTAAEQDTFRNAYNNAVHSGWIPDPRGR